jgi:hypothetical protein
MRLYGFPLHYMARPLDNLRLNSLVNQYRCLSGNRPIYKNESARMLLKILRSAGRWNPGGSEHHARRRHVRDFSGRRRAPRGNPAGGFAHGRSGGAGYAYWDESIGSIVCGSSGGGAFAEGRYERDVFVNTQKFAKVIEGLFESTGSSGCGACAVRKRGRRASGQFMSF